MKNKDSLKSMFHGASSWHIKKEREKARLLRSSSWWQKKLNQGMCYMCKGSFSKDQLTMEHLVPLARGGYSTKGNIEVFCKECNNKKKHTTIVESRLQQIKSSTKKSK